MLNSITSSCEATAGPVAFSISRWTIGGGGGASIGGDFEVASTIGQVDAGMMAGGEFSVEGGYWNSGTEPKVNHLVYLPVVIKQ